MTDLGARIDALHLEPGDIVAIKSEVRLSQEHASEIKRRVGEVVGEHPVLVFGPELSLMVVRYPLEATDG